MSNFKITKSWFYKLSEINSSEIFLEDWVSIALWDDVNSDLEVHLWESSNLEFFGAFDSESTKKTINIYQNNDNSKLHFRYLINSFANLEKNVTIKSEILSSNSSSDVKILSFAWENWFINLDWIIKINKWVIGVKWKLVEENIFLWNTSRIKWIPKLLVESDDVEASHSCNIEKIDDEKLFYLRSRWVWKDNALNMILEAKLRDLFKCFYMIDKQEYEKNIENTLKNIKWFL